MTFIIAHREFTERLRSRLFLGVNIALILVIVAAIVLPQIVGGDPEPPEVGVTDEASAEIVAATRQMAGEELGPRVVEFTDRGAGEEALRDGEIAALVVDGETLVVSGGAFPTQLETNLTATARALHLERALESAGLDADERAALLAAEPLTVETIGEEEAPLWGPGGLVLLLGLLVLYGLLIFHGQWVAQGIVEEKESRVIELLLAAIRTPQLLAGKIVGLGLLGFAQVVLLAAVALGAMALVDAVQIPAEIRGAIVLMVAWYALGFALYATVFAMSGAIAARSQDLQATTTPVIVLLVGAIFVAQAAMNQPTSTIATIGSYVPFSAPMVQPVRFAAGVSSIPEIALGVLLSVGTIAALVPLTGRLYRGGVLRTRRRVGLREAWTSAES